MGPYGLWIMAGFYILAGINHFVSPGFYRPMMPPWIPMHDRLIGLSGIIEVLLGAGLIYEPTRILSAWGVILLLVAVFPVHIYMYQARQTVFRQISPLIIYARIPFQFVLMYWAWIYTKGV